MTSFTGHVHATLAKTVEEQGQQGAVTHLGGGYEPQEEEKEGSGRYKPKTKE